MEGNLTKGPILKTLTKLAIPIMASSFLGTLYNITDMAWIGLLGSKAVAGVGVGGMFTWLSQGLASMSRMDFSQITFATAGFDVKNGRAGAGSTMRWTRRQRRSS